MRVCAQEEEYFVEAYERGRLTEVAARGPRECCAQTHALTRSGGALQFVESFEKLFRRRGRHAGSLERLSARFGSIKEVGQRPQHAPTL